MAQLAASSVVTAALNLMHAGQWSAATDLLRAAEIDDPAEVRALAMTLAEVAVDQDFAQQTDTAEEPLAAAEQTLKTSPDPTSRWDLNMLHLRKDYATELFHRPASAASTSHNDSHHADTGELDARPEHGADGRESATSGTAEAQSSADNRERRVSGAARAQVGADADGAVGGTTEAWGGAVGLGERAVGLRDGGADDGRRGLASFYAGLIADNLQGEPEAAFGHFTAAFEFGERASDELLMSFALRHLGDHAYTAGDLKLAREHWEQSTELRQKVGHLLGALAQQALLSVLLRDEGDAAGSRALAVEINRWSSQVNIPFLVHETAGLMR